MLRRTDAIAVLSTVLALLAACTSVREVTLPSPAVEVSGPGSPSPTLSPYSPAPRSNDPPPSPASSPGSPSPTPGGKEGKKVSPVNLDFARLVERGYPFYAPDGPFSLAWTDDDRNVLLLSGAQPSIGTKRTSDKLSIRFSLLGVGTFISDDGGCAVTIDKANVNALQGSIRCRRWESATSEEDVISAKLRFRAGSSDWES